MNNTITSRWLDQTLMLLSGKLEKNEEQFHQACETLYSYVKEKSNGRCISKKIHCPEQRKEMISQLFQQYKAGATSSELCRSRLLRKIVKHDRSNDQFLYFLFAEIVPAQIKQVPECEQLLKEPAVLYWMTALDATAGDPQALAAQKLILSDLPTNYSKILMEGRTKLGMALRQSTEQKWIGSQELSEIIKGISEEKPCPKPENLSKETAVSYFVNEYRQLIASGGPYKALFQNSIITGLNAYKKDPTVTKNDGIIQSKTSS